MIYPFDYKSKLTTVNCQSFKCRPSQYIFSLISELFQKCQTSIRGRVECNLGSVDGIDGSWDKFYPRVCYFDVHDYPFFPHG